ncbi:MAG: metallophosphoesterase family protein [Pseudomonadota bacterium]
MKELIKNSRLPRYHGQEWIQASLPEQGQSWLMGRQRSVGKDKGHRASSRDTLRELLERNEWQWPKRPLYFFSDLHADTDAFLASLVASGGVKKTGWKDEDFKLTRTGKRARFVIGGDCFDKGPSNLRLLRAIHRLIDRGARVRILAGNHDMRIKLGIRSVGMERDPLHDHFFIRMGSKAVPFLREVSDHYLQGRHALKGMPSTRECRRILYPPKRWFQEFPAMANWVMPEKRVEREVQRLEAKISSFEGDCEKVGLSLRRVYAAALKWQELFLHPKGEFSWFIERMRLAYRRGSFLFVHAGLDDRAAKMVCRQGIKQLNRLFHDHVREELFEFYYGPLANIIRTKYREVDLPLTHKGVNMIHQAGIHAIVHGHDNRHHGQRIMVRKGIVNFECDATVDQHSRRSEGLQGCGAAVTIFHPDKLVMGISTDYPFVKIFDPSSLG